jgi:hypothetical protein
MPRNLRLHVDERLVKVLRNVISYRDGSLVLKDDLSPWDEYWKSEADRIVSNKTYYGGTAPKRTSNDVNGNRGANHQIEDSRIAIEALRSLDLIVGFHPDQVSLWGVAASTNNRTLFLLPTSFDGMMKSCHNYRPQKQP